MKNVFVVVDCFGFAWGDVLDNLEDARQQLRDIREDCKQRGWDPDDIGLEIEVRKG